MVTTAMMVTPPLRLAMSALQRRSDRRQSETFDIRTVGVDGRFDMLSVRAALGHLVERSLRRGGAPHGLWRRTARCRSVGGNESGTVVSDTEKRCGIDISVALPEAEEEPLGRCRDRFSGPHGLADGNASDCQTAIRRRTSVGLGDHYVAHARYDPAERDDPRGRGDHRRTDGRPVFQPAIARAERAGRSTELVDDGGVDRLLVAR
jgi:hypothetical protein